MAGTATSAAPPFNTMALATQIQTVGETCLAALLVIAAVQGAFITKQYASNPLGELIVPPGPTVGVEDATIRPAATTDSKNDKALSPFTTSLSPQELEKILCDSNDTQVSCAAKKGWYHVNRFLVLLLPFLVSQWSFAMLRFGHLFHMACILSLAKIYDLFKQLPEMTDVQNETATTAAPAFGDSPHIVVIGDSMSVGIGCVNEFDPDKNSGILYRIEQLEPEDGENASNTGPVFPRALARTLSQRLGKPVSWRSAGVDGGDTRDIQKYLLPIIQEEVDKGQAPDIVVVLTASNDLKHILSSDPENSASVRGFRSNLMELVKQIRTISPKTKVVFPALPTYRLDRNSILNVFPLSFFLDGLIGLWDAQKIQAAMQIPGGIAHYVDLTVQEVNAWYKQDQERNNGGSEPTTLLAADGIHPNARCYAKWANYVGNHLVDTLQVEEEATNNEAASSNVKTTKNLNQKPIWGVVQTRKQASGTAMYKA